MIHRVHGFSSAMENLRTASINSGRVSARTYHHIKMAFDNKCNRIEYLESLLNHHEICTDCGGARLNGDCKCEGEGA